MHKNVCLNRVLGLSEDIKTIKDEFFEYELKTLNNLNKFLNSRKKILLLIHIFKYKKI